MPRRPRVFVAGAIYHVYCRTARHERILADAGEAQALLDIVRDVRDRDGFAILACSPMPSHYQLAPRFTVVARGKSGTRSLSEKPTKAPVAMAPACKAAE